MSGWAVTNVRWTLIWGRDAEREMKDLGAGVGPGWQGHRQNGLAHGFLALRATYCNLSHISLDGSLKALYGANFRPYQHCTSEKTPPADQ